MNKISVIDEITVPEIDTYVGDVKSELLAFGAFSSRSESTLDSLTQQQLSNLVPVDRFIKVLNLWRYSSMIYVSNGNARSRGIFRFTSPTVVCSFRW